MIEFIHANPNAFDRKWRPVTRFFDIDFDFNFTLYDYRWWGIEYTHDTEAFQKALKDLKLMQQLTN